MFLKSFLKKKRGYLLWLLVLCLAITVIYGCGGSDDGVTYVSSQSISGNASKGPIYPGTVTAYKVVGGQKDGVLGTAQTDQNGEYTISFQGYSGPVILEVYGQYNDEASTTGDPNRQIDPNKPLHAVISSTTGTIQAAITPLTEIAYKRATELGLGRDESDPNIINIINRANSGVSTSFGVDILRIQPIYVKDKDALEADPNDSQRKLQIKYGLYLAAISKMAADSNNIDPMVIVDRLADEIKDGKIGEAGEITLNDIGKVLVEVADPNNNIMDPNIMSLTAIQEIAEGQSALFDEFYDANDPNGTTVPESPTSGESSLDQAKAMISELRTIVLNTENAYVKENERFVNEIISFIIPQVIEPELGEMLGEIEQQAMILGEGLEMIMDDPNHFPVPDPNDLLENPQDNLPVEASTYIHDGYEVTLELDLATGVLLGKLFDPNEMAQFADPNYLYSLIHSMVDPNFPNGFLDPNEQAALQDPNQLALIFENMLVESGIDLEVFLLMNPDFISMFEDPNDLIYLGVDPGFLFLLNSNILSELEDPNIDVFRFEAGYTIKKDNIEKGTGSMAVSLDRQNGDIKLLTLNGTLEIASGTASLTDCGISFFEDQSDPNITGMLIHIGKFETANMMADSGFELQILGGPFGEDIIGEGDLLGLNQLSLSGSFGLLNSIQWDGNIRISTPTVVDPNFVYSSLALPSKIELIGKYTVQDPGADVGTIKAFDGRITANLHNGNELYQYYTDESNQFDPNMDIEILGVLSINGSEDMRLQMNCSTSSQANVFNISHLSIGGITITGDIILDDTGGDGVTILNLMNQDGIEINLVMDGTLTGNIMKDGVKLGLFDEMNGIPMVKYIDGEFDSLF